MNRRSLIKLEYFKILEIAAEYTVSSLGKQEMKKTEPVNQRKKVEQRLAELKEASHFFSVTGVNPAADFTDVRPYLEKVKIGGSLDLAALLNINQLLKGAANAKSVLQNAAVIAELPKLKEFANFQLYDCKTLMHEIDRCILPEGEIADGASTTLREIRRELRIQNQKIRDSLDKIIRSANLQKYIQEAVVTTRNGRYVIPVKSENKNSIPGIIHDQSSTGSTVFVEPQSVVEAGNEIRRLEAEEKHEIEKILRELSEQVNQSAMDIADNQKGMTWLDVLFAKVKFCNVYDCTCPELSNSMVIDIAQGRHPLIEREKCVPIDVTIGRTFRTLVITGPNTGGKTVSLKTVGLFVLLCQAGFFVPAVRAELGIFQDVLCDIGDEQAIEQNLSTFSSHMTNIIWILKNLKENSLILFDELGAGTDPVEGSALARAILSVLNEKNVLVFSTTHYSELKTFAFETEGIENASMEFDIETLMPTYRLMVGIPGKSNALAISQKLGLPQSIIEQAESAISRDELNANRLIADIEHNNVLAKKKSEEANKALAEAEQLKRYYEDKISQISEKRKQVMEEAKEQAARIVETAEEESRNIIKELRFSTDGVSGRDKNERIEQVREKFQKTKRQYQTEKKKTEEKEDWALQVTADNALPGMTVYVKSLKQTGTLLAVISPTEAQVQVGILKMKVSLKDLQKGKEEEKTSLPKERKKLNLHAETISSTIDLRGMTVEDALLEVDRYLDSAQLAGLQEVTLLHGKGTGALRSALHDWLRRHPHCQAFRIGKYGEGDAGVTIVTLK